MDRTKEEVAVPGIYAESGAVVGGLKNWITKGTLKLQSEAATVIIQELTSLD